jgi:WD repeat-containing protein 55
VQTFRLPTKSRSSRAYEFQDDDTYEARPRTPVTNGTGHIDTLWKTRRHKGSCRCLTIGVSGETLYSAGTDGLVKVARLETGLVENKIAIPYAKTRYVGPYLQCVFLPDMHALPANSLR